MPPVFGASVFGGSVFAGGASICFVDERIDMLELRLAQIKQMRVEVESQHAERTRQELRIEIEKERAAAQERAERQKKELELRVEKPGATPEASPAPR